MSAVSGSQLEEIVAEVLERIHAGDDPDLETLCAGQPDMEKAVREVVGLSDKAVRLQSSGTQLDPMLGVVLADRYRIASCIGAGASGVVYLADDRELRRAVAIKILRIEALAGGERVERFEREGDVLAALSHPNVVTVHDRGRTDDGRAFLVMEHVEGDSLLRRLEGRPPIRQLVRWIADLADGLQAAHEAGIYHRDVKPTNVLIREWDDAAVLVDFGTAACDAQATLARDDRSIGTPAYMAPEQLTPGERSTAAVDVYGLAATLYHGLTGRAPFEGTPTQVFAAIARRDPMPLGRLRRGLPRDLQAIVEQGMARDPRARYATTEDLAEDLESFLAFEPVVARYRGPVARAARRLWHSTFARAALVVTLALSIVAVSTYAYVSWQDARGIRRHAEWQQVWSEVEPLLTLWNVRDRVFADAERRDAVRAQLDRAASLADEAVPTFVVRAAFTLDHGDLPRAARDIAHVATQLGTPVARELAARYARVADEGAPTPIPVGNMPAATCAEDWYLLAFHAIRCGEMRQAMEWLDAESIGDFGPTLELRWTADIARLSRAPAETKTGMARELHDKVVRLEERNGMQTAMTAHLIGGVLLAQQRYGEAAKVIRDGLDLADASAALLFNLGIAERRLGNLESAAAHLRRAIELRPHMPQVAETLARVYLQGAWLRQHEASAVDEARSRIDDIPGLSDASKERLLGELEFGQTEDAFLPVVQQATRNPGDWFALFRVRQAMPNTLDTAEAEALSALVDAVVRHLAPEIHIPTPVSNPK